MTNNKKSQNTKTATLDITVSIKAHEGDKVMALNYKMKPAEWEPATVQSVRVGIQRDGTYHVSYDVILDRKGKPKKGWSIRSGDYEYDGRPLRLYVGNESIIQQT